MPKLNVFNFAPDADLVLVKDHSRGVTSLVFQVETRLSVSPTLWTTLEQQLSVGDMNGAYSAILKFAKSVLQRPGNSHAMIQAAFGLIKVNKRKARAALHRGARPAASAKRAPAATRRAAKRARHRR